MLLKPYCTTSDVASFLNLTLEAGQADDAINGAIKMIDFYTGRNFFADETATTRYYDGDNKRVVLIDDCISITKVERGLDKWGDFVETLASTDYILQPLNYSALNQPITMVLLKDRLWTFGIGNHKITAKWGYSEEVPDDIKQATIVLASGIYTQGGSGDNVKSERIGNFSITYADSAGWEAFERSKKVLNNYRKFVL